MKVAAYQAPLLPGGSMEAVGLIQNCVAHCETQGVEILCCPEAILGGLADYAANPLDIAFNVERGDLDDVLAPLASSTMTIIIGFTEITGMGQLFNSAAIFRGGLIVAIYRKIHPAIRKSVYQAGDRPSVFEIDGRTFGIMICNDSNYPELAKGIASHGACAVFIPTNNGLPSAKANVVDLTKQIDIQTAKEHGLPVIRADVAGSTPERISYGSSWIVDSNAHILQCGLPFTEEILIADVGI